tara:strand:+ start:6746 stop:7636 length:891 start_codon:yes stop_codon:yes gene_type:complete
MPLKIGILMGGLSEEREISLMTGQAVTEACNRLGYIVSEFSFRSNYYRLLKGLKSQDIIFNALHGGIGENGKIQSWMNENGIKNTGSGSESSALCMDKNKSKIIAKDNNIPTPNWEMLDSKNHLPALAMPYVIKPNDQGSTVGLTMVYNESEIKSAIQKAFTYSNSVMAEEYIQGNELTVTVLSDKAYPIIEIKPSHELYDYECKYIPGMSRYICPADLPIDLTKTIQKDTEKIFQKLGCGVYARADYILNNKQEYYFLEMNTLPGMTSTSLVPKSVNVAGMSFDELVKNIIEISL